MDLRFKNESGILKEKVLVCLISFEVRVKLQYFGWDFYIYAYKYLEKRQKEKINFDELPKTNSRIKITTKKNMRFGTKVLNFNF